MACNSTIQEIEQDGQIIRIEIQSSPDQIELVLESSDACHCTLQELNTAGITDIQTMTLAEYQALPEKTPTVLYLICN